MSSHSSKFSPIMSRAQQFDVPFTTEESNGFDRSAMVIRATDCIMVAQRAQWLVLSLTPGPDWDHYTSRHFHILPKGWRH